MDRREAIKRVALLLGGTISAPNLAALLRAAPGGDGAPVPSLLRADQKELIATIADHIIPATDTPGARAVGVADFIDRLITESYTEDDRTHFLNELARVDALAQRVFGQPFLELGPTQQKDLLIALDQYAYREAPVLIEVPFTEDIRDKITGPGEDPLEAPVDENAAGSMERSRAPFMRVMKELTLVGYYTSEVGATQELRHEPVPGRYEGCVPFSEIGRTWAV